MICGAVLYMAGAAQQALSRWTVFDGRVDFLLLALSSLCLFTNRRFGAVLGFFAGWLYGAIDGANCWQYIASRAVGGFLIAWIAETGIEKSLFSAFLAGIVGVLLCQIGLMFLAPPWSVSHYLGDTIKTAVYNGVLALPVYACLNRILGPRR